MYIWWLLLYGFIYSVSGTLARRLDQPYILFALFISVYWVILLHFLFRKKTLPDLWHLPAGRGCCLWKADTGGAFVRSGKSDAVWLQRAVVCRMA